MITSLRSKLYLLKYDVIRPGATKAYAETLQAERMSRDELEYLNWSRTKSLIEYAATHVPYYRRKFQQIDLDVKDLKSPEDFALVPILRRNDLKESFMDFISDEADPENDFNLVTTGGSSGEPLSVYHAKKVLRASMLWRSLSWWDVPLGSDFASVYRENRNSLKSRFRDWMIWWPGKRIQLDASGLDETAMYSFVKSFQRKMPPVLHGYAGAVDHLASYILKNNLDVPAPRAVWITSSPYSAVQANHIQKAFNAPVYDQYGCCEVFYLSAQCNVRQGLHINHDYRKIEFLNDELDPCPIGQYGQIAITNLQSKLFPIIRYLNGDRGRSLPGTCPCGRTLPLMDHVKGRMSDCLQLPSGKVISGDFLTTIFDDYPEDITRFQVYQSSDYRISIRVVPKNPDNPPVHIFNVVESRLDQYIQKSVPINIEAVDFIADDRGKLRFIVSDVSRKE